MTANKANDIIAKLDATFPGADFILIGDDRTQMIIPDHDNDESPVIIDLGLVESGLEAFVENADDEQDEDGAGVAAFLAVAEIKS